MWERELQAANEAATAAAKTLSQLFGQVKNVNKKGEIDLVTEADYQAEKILIEIIHRYFPGDNILSEEAGSREHASSRTWIIDPLDGTTNFVHGFPFFAVSIGLEAEGEMVAGVVLNPVMNERFEASRGNGAFLNHKPIAVSQTKHLKEALLATGFPYDIRDRHEEVLSRFKKMVIAAQGVRRPGSAALDICYVSAGKLDGFWEQGLHPWDTAAGVIIVKEAGGSLSTFQGNRYTPYEKSIVAANPLIHTQMIQVMKND